MTANSDDDNIEVLPGLREPESEAAEGQRSVTDLVEQPAKVMRIGTMIKQLLEAENIDAKRWTPRHMAGLIDQWKNRGWTPDKLPPAAAPMRQVWQAVGSEANWLMQCSSTHVNVNVVAQLVTAHWMIGDSSCVVHATLTMASTGGAASTSTGAASM